jgi:hypothetical protein
MSFEVRMRCRPRWRLKDTRLMIETDVDDFMNEVRNHITGVQTDPKWAQRVDLSFGARALGP